MKRWFPALVAVNLAWRLLRYGLDFPLWGDEARVAVNFFDRDLTGLTQPLDYLQIVPIFFLWSEWLISRALGLGEFSLRLLPVVAGIASLFVFRRLAERTLDKRAALAALALFAASYYPVRHATEVKSYSIDCLAGALLMLQGWRMMHGGSVRTFALTAACLVWWSYPSVFVAGGVLAVAWLHNRRPAFVGTGVLLALSFVVMYATVGQTQAGAGSFHVKSSHWENTFPPLDQPWLIPYWLLDMHTGNLFAYPNGGNHFGSSATFLLFVAGAVTLWRSGRRLLLAMLLSPFPLMLIAATFQKYPYGGSARIAQHVAPAICLLVGVGVVGVATALFRRRQRFALQGWCAVMMLFALLGMARDIRKPHKHPSDREVRRVVEGLDCDRWVVFAALQPSPFAPTLPLVKGWGGWGGSWARTEYYLRKNSPGVLQFAPNPGSIEPGPATLLIAYQDNAFPFPEKQFAQYRKALQNRLGPAIQSERHPLRKNRPEALRVHLYRSFEPN
ncbi:MAG: hypothetical protein ACYTEG_17090 [Planctomycetota bacterium]|jgi:hypothetical protein